MITGQLIQEMEHVDLPNGKEIIIVMMKITMKVVIGMVETVAETMSTHSIAALVNV